MWAFGLCETGDYKKAEEKARAALQINKSDSWATHALAHVLEMQGNCYIYPLVNLSRFHHFSTMFFK